MYTERCQQSKISIKEETANSK